MTTQNYAAQAAIQSVLTDAERHQLLSRANYPHLQVEPGAYLVKITEETVRSKLLAALAQGGASDDARDAERYRKLRRKVCIAGGQFHILNLAPTYVAPDAAIELDSVLDAALAAQVPQQGEA